MRLASASWRPWFLPAALLSLLCGTAFAQTLPTEELNSQLPKWVRFSAEERIRFEHFDGQLFRPDANDGYLLQRVRVGVSVSPARWLRFYAQTQDARVFWKTQKPYAPPFQDTWDLRQAYAEIGNPDKSPFALKIGRQEIALGEERLVGPANWGNTSRTFDAARATLRYKKLRLDAFAASVVGLHVGEIGSSDAGNNIHGLQGGLRDIVPGSLIEPYVLWRLQPGVKSESGIPGNTDMKVSGIRWAGKFRAFDYSTEMAIERGHVSTDSIHAWAGHWIVGYTLPAKRVPLRFTQEFNYATGDSDPHDGRRNTFDQLYPSVHDKLGFLDLIGWKNIEHWKSAVEWRPSKKLQLSLRLNEFWLANPHDALYTAQNAVIAQRADGSAGRRVGQELDVIGAYNWTRYAQFGAGYGHVFPGTFLKATTPGHSYSFPYAFIQTQF